MTREQADAFLLWVAQINETASAAADAAAAAAAATTDAAIQVASQAVEIVRQAGEIATLVGPAAEIIDVFFNGEPGEGLSVCVDKETHLVQKLERSRRPGVVVLQ